MATLATPQVAETYRLNVLLHKILFDIEYVYMGRNLPEPIKFGLTLFFRCFHVLNEVKYNQLLKSSAYRIKYIEKLSNKIAQYQQRFFNEIDHEDARVQWYIDNGLEEKLRENNLDLKTRCNLAMEPASIITGIFRVIFNDLTSNDNLTTANELIERFREKCYHTNVRAYRSELFFTDHRDAVRYGHHHNAEKIFLDFDKLHHHQTMCLHYLAFTDALPDYVVSKIRDVYDISIEEFLARIDPFVYYNKLLELHILNHNVTKMTETIKIMDQKCSRINADIISKLVESRSIVDLYIFHLLSRRPAIVSNLSNLVMQRHAKQIQPLILRYVISKIKADADGCSQMMASYVKNSYFLNFFFDDFIAIHDIISLNGHSFDQHDFTEYILEYSGLHGLNYPEPRILSYLQRLDILACRHSSGLDFERIFVEYAGPSGENVCKWIFAMASQRNIMFDLWALLFQLIDQSAGGEFWQWFFGFIQPYHHILIFDQIYKVMLDFLSFRVRFEHSTDITLVLDGCDKIMKMPYRKLFELAGEIDIKSSEHSFQILVILKWLERRIVAKRKRPNYGAINTNNNYLSFDNKISHWLKSRRS